MSHPRQPTRLRRALKRGGDAVVGAVVVTALRFLSRTDPDKMAALAGWVMRKLGPRLNEHKIARANLTAAFPEKSAAEIERILDGTWDNLGRVGVEIAHLDKLWDYDFDHPEGARRIEVPPDSAARFLQLREDGKPALIFCAHLANWELPAVCAAKNHMLSAALYRRPNIAAIDAWLHETRDANMGTLIPTGPTAPVKIAHALNRGTHVGMLVDQYYVRGVEVTFFGRRTNANPLLARLAQHIGCPIHGARIIRLPDHRFRVELTEALVVPRDADGKLDVAATTQAIISTIEGWVREYPEQWLWQHRRWR
ncbi:MAG TPA: lipid A biosynthesis lauroyl acyltransferase [Pseudolabrys sp.]|nr:lipid A biosynthesis lauroyl acyltransferase [Pseudolabrys sp.]